MKGLITAGGRGTRMRPVTFSTNKHFIPIANRPLLHYAIKEMVNAGIKEIGINYNPGQLKELRENLGTGKDFGVDFTYILQEEPKGLAHIVKVSQDFIGKDKFVMHLGDNIFYGGIGHLIKEFENSKANALLTVIHHPENSRMGVPYFNKDDELEKIVEKPDNPPHDLAVPGLYFFDVNALKAFKGKNKIKPSARGELEIASIYNWLLDNDYQVDIGEFNGVWKDPGKFNDWIDTNQFILDQKVKKEINSDLSDNVQIEGRVSIGENCKIKNSKLRGPLVIGDKVKITNSYIGPYSSIQDGCVIESSEIQNSVLMEEVEIKSPSKPLDSCVIGKQTVVQSNNRPYKTLELFLGNQCKLKM